MIASQTRTGEETKYPPTMITETHTEYHIRVLNAGRSLNSRTFQYTTSGMMNYLNK